MEQKLGSKTALLKMSEITPCRISADEIPSCIIQKHVKEYIVDPVNFPLASAFNDMSWHFFPHRRWNSETLNPVP
jgi:hypothetical protein